MFVKKKWSLKRWFVEALVKNELPGRIARYFFQGEGGMDYNVHQEERTGVCTRYAFAINGNRPELRVHGWFWVYDDRLEIQAVLPDGVKHQEPLIRNILEQELDQCIPTAV